MSTSSAPTPVDPSTNSLPLSWHLSEAGEYDESEAEAVRRWLAKQRTAYRSGRLSRERQEKLEQLPGFSWTADEDRWTQMYGLLLTVASREGHALVPQDHIEEGQRLGQWVNVQRTKFHDGKPSPERIAQLQAVEGWSWSAARWAGQWARNFDLLRRHARRTGSTLVRDDEVIDGVQIGAWARKQRSLHKSGSLSTERARQLAELPGWTWSVQGDKWTAAYALLRSYAEREGSARLPEGTFVDGYNLSYWARQQRSLYRAGRLSEERVRLLESLPEWSWEVLWADAWETAFAALVQYVTREGTARVKRDHTEGESRSARGATTSVATTGDRRSDGSVRLAWRLFPAGRGTPGRSDLQEGGQRAAAGLDPSGDKGLPTVGENHNVTRLDVRRGMLDGAEVVAGRVVDAVAVELHVAM
jgi:hypothetical protein